MSTISFPKQYYGIDFSGGLDAAKKIWISEAIFNRGRLLIKDCFCADSLCGSGKGREDCLNALFNFIKNAGFSAFGIDFPFGLPFDLIEDKSWIDFVKSFDLRFSNEHTFRKKCRLIANEKEVKRVTEKESKTPFASYNLRVYRQTYFGIRKLLAPLVKKDLASIVPMQKVKKGKPVIMEVCPASTLKQVNLYLPYKGKTEKHYEARKLIFGNIADSLGVKINFNRVRSIAIDDPNGDALDSIIAAITTFRAVNNENCLNRNYKDIYFIEGYVYS